MWRVVKAIILMFVAAWISHFLMHSRTDPASRNPSVSLTAIDELIANAALYDGKAVRVEGTVAGGVGIMGVGGFYLRQARSTDTILIMSRRGVPQAGVVMNVSGTFKQALAVNTFVYPVIIQDF